MQNFTTYASHSFTADGSLLGFAGSQVLSGSDALGTYEGSRTDWTVDGEQIFSTSYRVYDGGYVVAFAQEFDLSGGVRME